jgi:hypothetical protein
MVQRDGCWVKQTQSIGSTHEELGFCQRPAPTPGDDPMSRLVQACIAQADYRWENRALQAWARGEPVPPQEPDAEITRLCMQQAAAATGVQAENDALKARLADVGQDRDALRTVAEKDREFMQQSSEKLIGALGDAAKRPAPNATATATSTGTGTAKTDTDQQPPAATVVGIGAAPVPATPVKARAPAPGCRTPARKVADKPAPDCEKPPPPADAPRAG